MSSETSPENEPVPSLGLAGDREDLDWSATVTDMHARTMEHASLRDQSQAVVKRQATSLFSKVVEGQVIPRLVLAHQTTGGSDLAVTADASSALVEGFTTLLVSGHIDDAERFLVDLLRDGTTTSRLYIDLLAPAARLLGVYWEEDKFSFTEVTIGLGRLQTLLYRLSAQHSPHGGLDGLAPKALFLTPEGAQHSFGIRMVEDLFRQAGWSTVCEVSASFSTVADRLAQERFDLVGISISLQEQIEQTRDLIEKIRGLPGVAKLKIVLGGQLVVNDPDVARHVGADLFARDGMEAIAIAQKLGYGRRR